VAHLRTSETKQSEQARFERIIESRPAPLARFQEEPTYLNELTWEGEPSSRIIQSLCAQPGKTKRINETTRISLSFSCGFVNRFVMRGQEFQVCGS
jgi:hypothetical protein